MVFAFVICFCFLLFVFVICFCYMFLLFVFVICFCYLLFVFVICFCYLFLLFVFVYLFYIFFCYLFLYLFYISFVPYMMLFPKNYLGPFGRRMRVPTARVKIGFFRYTDGNFEEIGIGMEKNVVCGRSEHHVGRSGRFLVAFIGHQRFFQFSHIWYYF